MVTLPHASVIIRYIGQIERLVVPQTQFVE